jgi:hypothetical protein
MGVAAGDPLVQVTIYKGGIMFKKLFFILVTVTFLASCASGPSTEKPVNTMETEKGSTAWTSAYTPGSVEINPDFKWVGQEERSDRVATRKYYVWKNSDGDLVYIVDFKVRIQWSFPEDNDGLLGKDSGTDDPNLLAYTPNRFSVWKGINPNSVKVMKNLGVKLPECGASFQENKMAPSRSAAFFVVFYEATDCNYKNWGHIGTRAHEAFTIR